MQEGFVSCDIIVVGPISWSWPKEWVRYLSSYHVKLDSRTHQLYPFHLYGIIVRFETYKDDINRRIWKYNSRLEVTWYEMKREVTRTNFSSSPRLGAPEGVMCKG